MNYSAWATKCKLVCIAIARSQFTERCLLYAAFSIYISNLLSILFLSAATKAAAVTATLLLVFPCFAFNGSFHMK